MKKGKNNRKNYHRMKSGHSRLGLGFNLHAELWRRMEQIENVRQPKATISRASDKAMVITARSYNYLWGIDARAFYQSPFITKAFVERI